MEQQLAHINKRFVLPGETINIQNAKINNHSFYEENGKLKCLYFGLLETKQFRDQPYIDIAKKVATYLPEKNHFVVGIIKNKMGQQFIVDINAPSDAILGGLEFDGATKRNRPNLNIGDVVYTRISEFSKFIGSRVSCLNAGFSASKALGQLKGGMIVYGLNGKQKLIEQKIQVIKQYCQFQVAFGRNNILWFSCSHQKSQMIIYNIFNEVLKGCSDQLFNNLIKMFKQ